MNLPGHLEQSLVGITGPAKVTGHDVFNPSSPLDFQETKSTLGEGREVLPSSHKLHLAGPPTSQTSSRHVLGGPKSSVPCR